MSELVIKKHDFEVAKRGLKEFSQKKAEELILDTVRTNGRFLGLGDHKVTGDELNNRLCSIQQHLIYLNDTNNRTIKEFGEVYSALEALDKDYIQAILISIKATEETSKRIESTQEQIKRIVNDQKKTIEVMKKFKHKLDNYSHLEDIDNIWNNMEIYADKLDSLVQQSENTLEIVHNNQNAIEDLSEYKKILSAIAHLNDVDELWLSNEKHSAQLTELQKQDKDIKALICNNKELIDSVIAEVIEKNNTYIKSLTKKIKYGYLIAGTSLGLALIELVIILLKVI